MARQRSDPASKVMTNKTGRASGATAAGAQAQRMPQELSSSSSVGRSPVWPYVVVLAVLVAVAAVVVAFLGGKATSKPMSGAHPPSSVGIDDQARFRSLSQDQLPTPQDLEFHQVSEEPRIYVRDDFLSADECEFFKQQAQDRLEPAKVVQRTENKYDLQVATRNNEQVWLTYQEEESTPALRHVLKRLMRTARVPDDEVEAVQVGRYEATQKYELHVDSDPKSDVGRPMTILVYLSDVESGGETLFPVTDKNKAMCRAVWHEGGSDSPRTFGVKNCCDANVPGIVRISPKQGRAIMFFSHDVAGQVDPKSEHAACPVKAGVKWIIQRWFRFEPYQRLIFPADPRFDNLPNLASPLAATELLQAREAGVLPGRHDVRVLSQRPRIYLIEDFLSEDECRYLVALAQKLEVSEEPTAEPGSGPTRMFIPPEVEGGDATVSAIAKRMHSAVRIPFSNGENMQLGRYMSGSSLNLHLDSDPTNGLSRVYTLLVYLDGDGSEEAGGATVFPLSRCRELAHCCTGVGDQVMEDTETQEYLDASGLHGGPLLVPPKAGRAVLFASHNLRGRLDSRSVHGSCPAGASGKWIAQKWFHPHEIVGHPNLGFHPRLDLVGTP